MKATIFLFAACLWLGACRNTHTDNNNNDAYDQNNPNTTQGTYRNSQPPVDRGVDPRRTTAGQTTSSTQATTTSYRTTGTSTGSMQSTTTGSHMPAAGRTTNACDSLQKNATPYGSDNLGGGMSGPRSSNGNGVSGVCPPTG